MMIDDVELTQNLIRIPSISPANETSSVFLAGILENMGFETYTLNFGDVTNLFAIKGNKAPHFSFAGHFDVVPVGEGWSEDPFAGSIKDGKIYGRGAVDMKGAIASFVSALSNIDLNKLNGTISLMISGNEEAVADNGTPKILEWLQMQNIKIDDCLVGEPTNPNFVGQMVKNGRRGSINFELAVQGLQGHVAYHEIAHNPITDLVNILDRLKEHKLDEGTEIFDPSNLEITTIDVGNKASNIIPGSAKAKFNIRFNDLHSADSLNNWVRSICRHFTSNYTLAISSSSEAFKCNSPYLQDIVMVSIEEITGNRPILSTSGGTSDARFIRHYANIIEFGLINELAHKADENIDIGELKKLTKIYERIVLKYFEQQEVDLSTI